MTISGIAPMTYAGFTSIPDGTRIVNYGFDQCVAAANLYHEGVLGLPLPSGFGAAHQWWAEFTKQPNLYRNYQPSGEPIPGALFVARGGIYDPIYGHIGIVTAVNNDGSFQTIEQNAGTWRYLGRYTRRKGPGLFGFLHPNLNPAITAAPQATPTRQEEEDDMAKTAGFTFTRGKEQINVLVNTTSGFYSEFSSSEGGYNTGIARALDTGSFERITESHADRLREDCAAVRQGK